MSPKVRACPVACVVLAAGAGTRFGEPKAGALLPTGERFLDAVVRTALDAGADPVIAVVPPGIPVPASARGVVNPNARSEQIDSLRAGLGQLVDTPSLAVLVWPVDHPFVLLTSVLAILDGFARARAPVVVPVHEGRRGHPVLFARAVWPELLNVSDEGARSVVHAHAAQVLEVAVGDAGVRRNVDTKSDLTTTTPDDGGSEL